jgi:hypothetical protein
MVKPYASRQATALSNEIQCSEFWTEENSDKRAAEPAADQCIRLKWAAWS